MSESSLLQLQHRPSFLFSFPFASLGFFLFYFRFIATGKNDNFVETPVSLSICMEIMTEFV